MWRVKLECYYIFNHWETLWIEWLLVFITKNIKIINVFFKDIQKIYLQVPWSLRRASALCHAHLPLLNPSLRSHSHNCLHPLMLLPLYTPTHLTPDIMHPRSLSTPLWGVGSMLVVIRYGQRNRLILTSVWSAKEALDWGMSGVCVSVCVCL